MIPFEKYLTKNGWSPFHDTGNGLHSGYISISTSVAGGLCNFYYHNDDVEKKYPVCIGLNEKGKPVTLIYPRPIIEEMIPGGKCIHRFATDDEMNRILSAGKFDDLLNEITNTRILT